MKCPFKFRLQGFEGGEECDSECALLIMHRRTHDKACAIAVLGNCTADTAIVNYESEHEGKPVGALGRLGDEDG